MKATVVVSVVLVRDGELLLVQEGKDYCRGQWGVPGGRLEEGEGLVEGARREVLEETGYDVRITGLTPVRRYMSQYGHHCVRFNFVAELLGGEPAVDGQEILQLRWLPLAEFDQLADGEIRSPHVARAIIGDVRAGRIHSLEIIADLIGG